MSGTEEWKQKWPKKTLVYLLLSVMKHFLTSCLPSSHDSFISGYHQMKILQLLSGHPQYIMRQNHNLAAHICCATLMRDVTGLKFVLSRSFNLHGGSKTKRSAWCITSRWSTESQDRGMALQEWQTGWGDMHTHDIPKGVFSILLPLCQTLSRAHIPAALLFPSLLLLDRGLSCNLFFNLSLSHSAVCAVLLPREQCRRAAGHLLAGRFLFRAVSLW